MIINRTVTALVLSAALATTMAAFAGETVGPSGEKATPTSELTLTDAEAAKLKEGKFTAALLWHTSSDFVNAVTAGAKDEFARLGMTVIAQTDAGFDAAKQKSDVETIPRQEAQRDPGPAARSRHLRRSVQARRRLGREDRPAFQQ